MVLANSLVFIQSYISETQQRAKVNNAHSTYSDILYQERIQDEAKEASASFKKWNIALKEYRS